MRLFVLILLLFMLVLFARWFVGVGIGAPWLPLRRRDMEAALRIAPIEKADIVIDLGSGDGRLLVPAAERGATVIGYEINPFLAWFSRRRLRPFSSRARIYRKNLLSADISEATLIYIFGITELMPKLSKKLKREAKPEARIVSFAFELPGLEEVKRDGIARRYRIK